MKNKLLLLLSFASVLVFPTFVMLFGNNNLEHSQSFCPFMMMTGLPCPGCGITKSLVYLYTGDISDSFKAHLFGIPTAIFSATAIVILCTELIFRKSFTFKIMYSKKIAFSILIVWMVYHGMRLCIYLSQNSINDILTHSIWR